MKVFIPAAGYAMRLYPLTENVPKALLPVGGKPMLTRILDKLSVVDLEEIVVISNDKFARQFVDWARLCQTVLSLHIINDGTKSNDDRLGTVGDLALALSVKPIEDDLLIIAGDNLFEFSVKDFVSFAQRQAGSVIAVFDVGDKVLAKQSGVVKLEGSRIVEFVEKPENPSSSLVSTMCYYLKKEDVGLIQQYLKEGNKSDRAGDFIAWLVARKPVYAFSFSEAWFDIGTKEQYDLVCARYEQ